MIAIGVLILVFVLIIIPEKFISIFPLRLSKYKNGKITYMKKIFIASIVLTLNFIYSHSSNYGYNIIELSNRQTLGDINEDGEINIQDVILIINLVLNDNYIDIGDLNNDNEVDVLDVVILVNLILSTI